MNKIHSCLTKVVVGKGNDTEKILDKPRTEDACHDENEMDYTQTENTHMMQQAMSDRVDFIGISPACR